ncbi:AAA family ATPase [Oscillospiraceae bacterium HV4-5-C5C]|nr:AAA family ATPase [Oscillospiraceae bacterium HV4-5-C5C]
MSGRLTITQIKVQAFGCLRNRILQPGPGLNLLCAGNEAGKTTLAQFIAAMLYGLTGGGRKAEDNLRRLYMPWSEACCGGELELLCDGQRWRLERQFGLTRAADRLRLQDLDHGLDIALGQIEPGEYLSGLGPAAFRSLAMLQGQQLADFQPDWSELARWDAAKNRGAEPAAVRSAERPTEAPCGPAAAAAEEESLADYAAVSRQLTAELNRLDGVGRRGGALAQTQAALAQTELQLQALQQQRQQQVALEQRQQAVYAQLAALDEQKPQPEVAVPAAFEPESAGSAGPDPQIAAQPLTTGPAPRARAWVFPVILTLVLAAGLTLTFWPAGTRLPGGLEADLHTAAWGRGAALTAGLLLLLWLLYLLLRRRPGQSQPQPDLTDIMEQPGTASARSAEPALPDAMGIRQGRPSEQPAATAWDTWQAQRDRLLLAAGQLDRQRQDGADWPQRFQQLRQRQQVLSAELAARQYRRDLLQLAQTCLQQAESQRRSQFQPQVLELAQSYLQDLTLGRYARLALSRQPAGTRRAALKEQLEFLAPENQALYPVYYLSQGTRQQSWLALRLAALSFSDPEGYSPLLLDDVLQSFDEDRQDACLIWLTELAGRFERQIFCFDSPSRLADRAGDLQLPLTLLTLTQPGAQPG